MANSNNSNRYLSGGKKSFLKGKTFILLIGLLLGAGIMVAVYKTSVYFSSDESCMMCHVHPHVENSWKLSKHVNNGSGVKTHCVACHLPPQSDTWNHYTAKAKLGLKDVWSYLTKDSADFNWELKSELEQAVKYIPNESCKECHQNLFPEGINQDGITAHLYYDENEEKLDLQCISCHLDAGHYNPDYKHGKLTGIPGASATANVDTSLYFKTATPVTSFADYTEQIPGTAVSFKMIAIPGGTFQMGSTTKEPFHKEDEAPVRNVTVSPFFMAEVEVTWDQYWAFYGQTMSEGRTPPETVYANNSSVYKQGVEFQFSSQRIEAIRTRFTFTGAWFWNTYGNNDPVYTASNEIVDNEALPYIGLYEYDRDMRYEQFYTNLMIDTDIPRLGLGFSISLQCQWLQMHQTVRASEDPIAYMDLQGQMHPWTEACMDDLYLQHLHQDFASGVFVPQKERFSMSANLKVTKSFLQEKLRLALFVNGIAYCAPPYYVYGVKIKRRNSPYFGMELNFRI